MQIKVKESNVMERCSGCNKGKSGQNLIWADGEQTHLCDDCVEDLKELL